MADPLSIAASIVALVTVGTQITKIIATLRQNDKAVPPELLELGTEVSVLHLILERINEALDQRRPPFSSTFHRQDENLELTLRSCNDTLRAAAATVSSVETQLAGRRTDRLLVVMSSSSLREEIKTLLATLERRKTSLLLCLQLSSMWVTCPRKFTSIGLIWSD